jgi:hypothetical protein
MSDYKRCVCDQACGGAILLGQLRDGLRTMVANAEMGDVPSEDTLAVMRELIESVEP